jgi:hypothetical protein
MKKILLAFALTFVISSSLADPRDQRDHHEWHERGDHFGWGEFVGGIVLGGIIAHEVSGHNYDTDEREVRRVTICDDVPLYDWRHIPIYDFHGNQVIVHKCRDEWVHID